MTEQRAGEVSGSAEALPSVPPVNEPALRELSESSDRRSDLRFEFLEGLAHALDGLATQASAVGLPETASDLRGVAHGYREAINEF